MFCTLLLLVAAPDLPALQGPMVAVAWSKGPADLTHISPMIWVRKNSDPVELAAQSKQLPAGQAAVFLWDLARDVLNSPEDRAIAADGTTLEFVGPVLTGGIAELKRRALAFFEPYQAAGGRCDFLVLDFEGGLSNWHLKPDAIRALWNDPRSGPLKEQLGLDDVEQVVNWRSGKSYLTWNMVLGHLVAKALNEGLFEPVRALYPAVKSSNYGGYEMTPENAVPDLNGHLQPHDNTCGTHGSCAFYGGIGQLAQRKLAGEQPYGDTPFAVLRWELNRLRAIQRSSNQPFLPWISHKNYQGSRYRDNDYYQELVYHLALGGAQDILFWNPDRWRDNQDPNHYRTDEHDRLVDDLLDELNRKFGDQPRVPVTLQAFAWDAPLLVSGMQVGEQVLWRITAPPGVKQIEVKPAGQVLELDGPGVWYESRPGQALAFVAVE